MQHKKILKIVLAATDKKLHKANQLVFEDCPVVECHFGSILDVKCDAVVSPANSFGFMNGGVDQVYIDRFGEQLQKRVIEYCGWQEWKELLVGQALVFHTNEHDEIGYLIAAPTMRVPMALPRGTVNPYLACRAALLAAQKHDSINTVAFPGMGTGIGRVEPRLFAKQMRAAVYEVIFGENRFPRSCADAQEQHKWLGGNQILDLHATDGCDEQELEVLA